MSSYSGPNIVKSGLILDLDAGNRKSTINNTKNLINNAEWITVGTSTLPWPNNGLSTQNQLLFDADPWGNQSLVLKTIPTSGVSGANGGWEGCTPSYWVSIDRTKKYRSCVWVRRTSTNTAGTFYHGLHTDGTGDIVQSNDTTNTNPYWACQNIGYLTLNQWYLHVGHIFPYGSTPTVDPTSGYWTNGTWMSNPGCNITGSDPRFPSNATVLRNRVYHYYSADPNSNIELFYPRIDCCDGTEPTIQDIFNNGPSQLKDQSSYGNHHAMTYKPVFGISNGGNFTLDGTSHGFYRSGALNGVTNTCTVVLWYKTTDSAELWVRGNQNNAVYLSASSGNNYYHAGCGTPTNYVDLAQVTNPVTEGYRNGNYHMWEAKSVDFSSWTYFDWFSYPGSWYMAGSVAKILVYNRNLSAAESQQNYAALRGRYGI